jgi:prepilin-type N-terminal cleavage/methylation domain-containing protein
MRGFTLVEILVALVLLSVAAVGLGECLLVAQRAQIESGRWMRAVALAEEGLERARHSGCPGAELVDGYARTCVADGDATLTRLEVVVRWRGQAIHLATWVRP